MNSNTKAALLLDERQAVDESSFVEIRVWRVPKPVLASMHSYKYALAYILNEVCVLRYDNESGKGDHIHRGRKEFVYNFTTPEKLLADFWLDVEGVRK